MASQDTITRPEYERTLQGMMRRFIEIADRTIEDDQGFMAIAEKCISIAQHGYQPQGLQDEK